MNAYQRLIRLMAQKLSSSPPPSLQQMGVDQEDNPVMIQFYTWESEGTAEQSWWKHFEQEVTRLKEWGVTRVWLPPLTKGSTGSSSVGYDVYDHWDLGEFDQKGTVATRWGTKQELVDACSVARANGVNIIVDAVLNHKCGADRSEVITGTPVDPKNRLVVKGKSREIEAWTIFDFPNRNGEYSSMKWDYRHFTGVDWDSKTKTKDIFYIDGPGRKGWSKHVADELGNYDYLLGCDIDHRQIDVQEDIFNWGSWVLSTTGGAGFRMDAIKHFDRRFISEFLNRVRKTLKLPKMFAVSEYWISDIDILEGYLMHLEGETSFFDVPLHEKLHQASKLGPKYDLRKIFKDTLVERRPWDAVTFVDNHDTEIGQSLESWVYSSFKVQAYALILLRSGGLPCLFYGDLYPNQQWYDQSVGPKVERLVEARKRFAYGPTKDYFRYKDCIGWVREGDAAHPGSGCVVIIRSGKALPKKIEEAPAITVENSQQDISAQKLETITEELPEFHGEILVRVKFTGDARNTTIPTRFRDYLGGINEHVTVSPDGLGLFPCPEYGAAVWVVHNE